MNKNTLKKILKKVNAIPDLNSSNVIKEIKDILQKEDPEIYKAWEGKRDIESIHFHYTISPKVLFPGQAPSREVCFHLLEIAIIEDLSQVVEALMEAKADIIDIGHRLDRRDILTEVNLNKQRDTNIEVVKRKNLKGATALHIAAQNGSIKTAEYLISKKAEIDAKDDRGYPPLFLAAAYGHREMVKFLLNQGAQVDIKNDKNQSLLHLAVIEKNIAAVPILLEEGLNPNEKDKDGKTPIDLAKNFNMKGTLKSHMPNKLWRAILTRNPETANKILNHCKKNGSIVEVLDNFVLEAEKVAGKNNKDIIKAMQKAQAVGFACGGGIAAVIGIPIAIALPLSYAMTPGIIAATTIAGGAGFIGLLCLGFAVFHAFKEFPSAQVNEPRSTGAGAETPNLG